MTYNSVSVLLTEIINGKDLIVTYF